MRFSAQLVTGLVLAAGTVSAGLHQGSSYEANTSTELAIKPTETATETATEAATDAATSAPASAVSSSTSTTSVPLIHHSDATSHTEAAPAESSAAAPESYRPGVHASENVAATTATATSAAAAATGAVESHPAPPAAQTSVPLIKPSAASGAAPAASSGAARSSTASHPKSTGSHDYVGQHNNNEEESTGDSGSASPSTGLHQSPGSKVVLPGLAALGSLAIGLLILI
ncbi:uncharacterized protein ACLA_072700 [Aspergillus clavatus NRRL 1]|uniref:GPI anchored protein n=1 Tax=Aspergillus clavatus (strain ATCC 1007 / CBS 513.65 / DSM 816 / NCTC 3887 / NRRL 1 / QM 1276 / 107) TaxID=344612 RepID=A1C766_ASPCL|nr:uncharacterized protein ACLA_072700 [Aspergillus clavatus NRRL 1]EAW14237.1 conserved hypothetical protein [Aspergillus clavatus NRRL 1]